MGGATIYIYINKYVYMYICIYVRVYIYIYPYLHVNLYRVPRGSSLPVEVLRPKRAAAETSVAGSSPTCHQDLSCSLEDYTILYYTILYYTILYYTILYYTILY